MVDRFAVDWRTAGLDDATAALLSFSEQLTTDPAAGGADAIQALRDVGWGDRAIHDAAQVCSYFNYINRVADALGIDKETWIDSVGVTVE